jgi:hypothetical protein
MTHKFKGKTPVKTGDSVHLIVDDEVYATVRVRDALAVQFTVSVNKRIRYFFYEDKGITWKIKAGK